MLCTSFSFLFLLGAKKKKKMFKEGILSPEIPFFPQNRPFSKIRISDDHRINKKSKEQHIIIIRVRVTCSLRGGGGVFLLIMIIKITESESSAGTGINIF